MQRELDQARTGQAKAEHRATEAEKLVARTQAHIDGERSAKTVLSAHVGELQAAAFGRELRACCSRGGLDGRTDQPSGLAEPDRGDAAFDRSNASTGCTFFTRRDLAGVVREQVKTQVPKNSPRKR